MNLLNFINIAQASELKVFIDENFTELSQDGNVKIIPNYYNIWKFGISKSRPIVYIYIFVDVDVTLPADNEFGIKDPIRCTSLITKPIYVDGKLLKKLVVKSENMHMFEHAPETLFTPNNKSPEKYGDLSYIMDLDSIDFIDDDSVSDIDTLAELAICQLHLKAENKVLKELTVQSRTPDDFSESEIKRKEYLNFHNISGGKYLPNKGSGEGKYNNCIEISISGYSNLPSLNEVKKRISENKSQTSAGELLKQKYLQYKESKFETDDLMAMLTSVEENLHNIDNLISYQCFLFSSTKMLPDGTSGNLQVTKTIDDKQVNFKFNV